MCVETKVVDVNEVPPSGGCDDCGDNCDCDEENCDCDPPAPSNNLSLDYNNVSVPVTLNEIYAAECECQCVNMAALFSYRDEKDDSTFSDIFLPEIAIEYETLVKIFFADAGKGFSTHILNKIWKGIKGLCLANTYFETYEAKTGIDRDKIPAVSKIRVHKECSFPRITLKASKIVALNLVELNNALGSVDLRLDGNLCVSTVFHLFCETLGVGVKVTLRFAVKNVPEAVRGTTANDEDIIFDFCNV